MRTVKEVAALAGVTVRALHHYDEIGLLRPATRTDAGYRLYGHEDLLRLQEILFYRELGLGLTEIQSVMDDAGRDRAAVLRRQHAQLLARAERLLDLAAAVERALTAEEAHMNLTDEELFEVFGDFDPREHEDEVRERWGDSDAYRQSARRARSYGKQQWQAVKDEADAITRAFADLLTHGVDPRADEATDLAEQHRAHIERWFYPCSREMHAALGDMYVQDQRFTVSWDAVAPGLAAFVRDAFSANAARG